jgi:hypothetical protein
LKTKTDKSLIKEEHNQDLISAIIDSNGRNLTKIKGQKSKISKSKLKFSSKITRTQHSWRKTKNTSKPKKRKITLKVWLSTSIKRNK